MTRPRLAALVLCVPGFWAASAAVSIAQRGSPRERSMYVSVVDQNGVPVPDLSTSDFIVREDNATREILRVAPADDPMHIAVLVDTSQAARDHIQHMRQALPPFAAELTAGGRKNEIAIIGIGERPTILSEYSSDPAQIKKGIDRIWALDGAGMYLLDAIIETCRGFQTREAGRPVIIAIATEGQDFSNRQHDQAVDPLKATGTAFYALMIGQPDTSLSPESRERAIVLDEGPRATGGYHSQLLTSISLPERLKQLAAQLKNQYKVTYSRPESLIPPEKITVAANKAGLTARGTPMREEQVRR